MEISFNIFKAGLFKVNSFIFIIFLTNDVCPNLEQILLEGQEHHQWKQDQESHITFTNFYKLAACLYLHNITGQLLLQKIFFIQCLLYMKSNLPFGNAREKMYPFFLPNLQVGGDERRPFFVHLSERDAATRQKADYDGLLPPPKFYYK